MAENVMDRLRELEWAATYVKTHPPRRCRCGGSCPECLELARALRKINASTMLELIAVAKKQADVIASKIVESVKDEVSAKLRRALRDLLMSRDVSWEENGKGHDWREAVEAAREALGDPLA